MDRMQEEYEQRSGRPGQVNKVASLSAKLGSLLVLGGHDGIGECHVFATSEDGVMRIANTIGAHRIRSYPHLANYKHSIDVYFDPAAAYFGPLVDLGKEWDAALFPTLPPLAAPPHGSYVYVDGNRYTSSFWDFQGSCHGNGCVYFVVVCVY